MSEERQQSDEAGGGGISLAQALSRLEASQGARFAEVFGHGSLVVEIFAPRGVDLQQPHTRDEVYVVVCGAGEFLNGGARRDVSAGDLLFVPAGVEHRFENFTDDLLLWVLFYGPEGGEG